VADATSPGDAEPGERQDGQPARELLLAPGSVSESQRRGFSLFFLAQK